MRRYITLAATLLALGGTLALAQTTPADRERARIQNQLGWENMKAEAWEAAAKSFQNAIDIDPEYEYAYYSLGRANMALKRYAAAIAALVKCRDLARAQAGRQFTNVQEAQRYRNNRLTELDEQIRMMQTGPQTPQAQDLVRQLQNQRRDVQEAIDRGTTNTVSLDAKAPPYVLLSLGSAYFRAGQMADAEREYKETIAADDRSGEAHNNLAVVYLMTGRYADAERSIAAAKKVGFRVNPQLEADIKAKKQAGS